jgi:hypothetical protein
MKTFAEVIQEKIERQLNELDTASDQYAGRMQVGSSKQTSGQMKVNKFGWPIDSDQERDVKQQHANDRVRNYIKQSAQKRQNQLTWAANQFKNANPNNRMEEPMGKLEDTIREAMEKGKDDTWVPKYLKNERALGEARRKAEAETEKKNLNG